MYDQNPLLHKLTVDDLARPYVSGIASRSGKRGTSRRDPFTIAIAALTVITLGAYGATAVKANTSEAPRVNPHPPIVATSEATDLHPVATAAVARPAEAPRVNPHPPIVATSEATDLHPVATAAVARPAEAPRVNPHPPIVPVGQPADLQLVADYMVCSELAEIRVLHAAEAMACTTLYTEVKLSFLPNIDAADYAAMSVEERVDVNRQGYARYTAWRNAIPSRWLSWKPMRGPGSAKPGCELLRHVCTADREGGPAGPPFLHVIGTARLAGRIGARRRLPAAESAADLLLRRPGQISRKN
ncbi:MAG: hypothetical protein ACE368_04880 [Paracoccaceae bacterium]